MFALRKSDWSFQYTEKEFEGQKEKYNLKEASEDQIRLWEL